MPQQRFHAFAALLVVFTFQVATPSLYADERWFPTRVDWTCRVVGGETICDLSAEGAPPTMSYPTGVVAKVWYRIYKGPVVGRGQVLMTKEALMNCASTASGIKCTAVGELKLAAGIAATSDPSPITVDLNIYPTSGVVTPLFDWNGDGAMTANVEGLTVLRFLLGFRGAALTNGVTLKAGLTTASVEEQLAVGIWNGWFQFGSTTNPRSTNEGLILMRCLLGLRGAPLIAGLTGYVSATADSQCNCCWRSTSRSVRIRLDRRATPHSNTRPKSKHNARRRHCSAQTVRVRPNSEVSANRSKSRTSDSRETMVRR